MYIICIIYVKSLSMLGFVVFFWVFLRPRRFLSKSSRFSLVFLFFLGPATFFCLKVQGFLGFSCFFWRPQRFLPKKIRFFLGFPGFLCEHAAQIRCFLRGGGKRAGRAKLQPRGVDERRANPLARLPPTLVRPARREGIVWTRNKIESNMKYVDQVCV